MRSRTTRTSTGDMLTPVVGVLGVLLGLTLLAVWFDQRASISLASRADALMVVIRQEGDQVTFEAYDNVGRLWSTPGVTRAVSTVLVTIRRDQTGETALWQVETVTPHAGPIAYGRVPEGFVQMKKPGTGPPPALRADDAYNVTVLGPGGTGRAHFTLHTPSRGPR